MIKILHVSSANSWRGGEQQLSYIIEALNNFNVIQTVLCIKNSPVEKHCINKNINVVSLKKSNGLSLLWAKQIKTICSKNSMSFIHCHDSKAHSYSILSADLFTNKTPIIIHRKVVFKLKRTFFTKYKYNHRLVKKIICISKAVEQEVKKIAIKDNTVIIYDSVKKHMSNTNINIRQLYNIPKENSLIVYLAALSYEKDHLTFINTAKVLIEKNQHLTFLIIGEGKLKSSIEQYINNLSLQKHIILTGYIDNVKSLIHQFDLLLFTSKHEGLGTTVLDFFLEKKPVVCTKSGGTEEIVANYSTGIICEKEDVNCLADGVLKIISDYDFKTKIVNNAYNYVKESHNINNMGELIYNVYNSED